MLNGSGVTGAAAGASAALAQHGFVSAGTGDDFRRSVTTSEVRYPPANEAEARVVARWVPDAQLVSDGSITGADVVVVVGKSFSGIRRATAPPATTPAGSASASPGSSPAPSTAGADATSCA